MGCELGDDPVHLSCGRISEDIEGTEAAIGWLEGVLTYPSAIDIVVEVRLWADGLVHIGEVNGRDLRRPCLLCASCADSSLG